MLSALVVEDSRLAREGLVRLLAAHPEIEVIGQVEHAQAALAFMAERRPDVLFLDIHLPGGDGFSLLEQLDNLPHLIFTTAYSEYAIRSFDHPTVDYLLKPIRPERLAQAVAKLLALPAQGERAEAAGPLEPHSKVFVKDGNHCHLVALERIDAIDSCKNYVQLGFQDEQGLPRKAYVKKALAQVEARLPRSLFFRANRQTLVNLQAITRIEETLRDRMLLTLRDGRRIEISRRQATELRSRLSL